jgi:hypothetical protein
MRKYPRFVDRKVRNGRVKIFGRWFYPSEQWLKYDWRLDEVWYHFGLYEGAPGDLKDFGFLLGTTESSKKSMRGEEYDHGPELIDGHFPWCWWEARDD